MDKIKSIKILLIVFYTVGIVGFCIPATQGLFKKLIPLALVGNLALLLLFNSPKTIKAYIIIVLTIVLSFAIEVIGVETGILFGTYTYGTALGIKLFNTPLLIGANWMVLTYSAGIMLHKIKSNVLGILIGALMVTMFDYIMEPVAISTNMWQWQNNIIPIQNYLMWFVVSIFLLSIFRFSGVKYSNPLAKIIFILQLAFFLSLNIYFKF